MGIFHKETFSSKVNDKYSIINKTIFCYIRWELVSQLFSVVLKTFLVWYKRLKVEMSNLHGYQNINSLPLQKKDKENAKHTHWWQDSLPLLTRFTTSKRKDQETSKQTFLTTFTTSKRR